MGAPAGHRTVAGELARALELDPRELTVAGRTDTGVHAEANVVSLAAGRLLPAVALNDRLPADIAVRATAPAADSFDARRDARSAKLCLPPEHGPEPRSAARPLRASPSPITWSSPPSTSTPRPSPGPMTSPRSRRTETEHVHFDRTVTAAEWRADGERLEFRITADAFMRHMVRVLVGTMLDRPDPEYFSTLLDGRHSAAGRTAPPHGPRYGRHLLTAKHRRLTPMFDSRSRMCVVHRCRHGPPPA